MSKKYNPTQEITDLIIEKYKNGISGNALSKEFNVSNTTIYQFLRRNNVEVNKDTESKYLRYGKPTDIVVLPRVNDYYVYLHKSKEDDSIFYVGKGRGNRYKATSNRNDLWKEKAALGYYSEFYAENLDETSALDLERDLIISLSNLVNFPPANKLAFTAEDYREYFKVNPESPSGLDRISKTWSGTHYKGDVGNTGYIATRVNKSKDCSNIEKKYWKAKFKSKGVLIHRIIWTLVNGDIPDNFIIDHIDGNGLNNKIENLRMISQGDNCRNRNKAINNTSGETGVFRFNEQGVLGWRAVVKCSVGNVSKRYYDHKIGNERAFEYAVLWRKSKLKELIEQGAGYTERHGT